VKIHSLNLLTLALLLVTACAPAEEGAGEDVGEDASSPAPDAGAADASSPSEDTGEDAAGEVDPGATCQTSPAHPRCEADPDAFDGWDTASVVSAIEFAFDDTCCFDIDGDGINDNALGELLELAEGFDVDVESFNASIAESIASGSLVLLVEHQGAVSQGGDFAINYYLGTQDGDFTAPTAQGPNRYTVDRGSLRSGVWPSARMDQATHDGASMSAGPGVVEIATELLGPVFSVRITAAQIEATVDPASTFGEEGVRLTGGALGGAVRVSEIFDAINDVYDANCGCAPLPDGARLLSYDPASLADAACSAPDNDTSACEADSVCVTAYELCGFVGLAGLVVDIDADAPGTDCVDAGTCDAISLGTTFETLGATITGVTP
jgi:hypothetical protein